MNSYYTVLLTVSTFFALCLAKCSGQPHTTDRTNTDTAAELWYKIDSLSRLLDEHDAQLKAAHERAAATATPDEIRALTAPQAAAAAPTTSTPAASTGETWTHPKTGEVYEVHTGKRGGRYIIRTSRDGNEYKQYLK